ncbi:MAG: tRNA (guanosine(37)-N1)-methyltransferase TrmD [Candidatus Competibacterales bacterium]
MRIDVLTLFPEMFAAVRDFGITGRALKQGLLTLHCWNPRDDAPDRHRTVDDRPYGGGPGMVMKVQPLRDALGRARAAAGDKGWTVYLSPQGRRLDQNALGELAKRPHLVLVAGRYEGLDERFVEGEVDEELSIGDYVLSGGELAAMVIIDGVTRLLPEALGDPESARQDSFSTGLLDHPHYTRPEVVDDLEVPAVLLSGDHSAIQRWRRHQALIRTWQRRPDLLAHCPLDAEQQGWLAALMATSPYPTTD